MQKTEELNIEEFDVTEEVINGETYKVYRSKNIYKEQDIVSQISFLDEESKNNIYG